MSSGDKSKSKSVSLAPELWEKVEAKAGADYNGNRSSYFRDLAEADLAGGVAPSPDASDAIVRLAAAFHPTVRAALELQLNDAGDGTPVNQPRLIARFLDALHYALERKEGFNANGTFQLWESEHVLKQAFAGNTALNRFVTKDPELNEGEAPAYTPSGKQKKVRA